MFGSDIHGRGIDTLIAGQHILDLCGELRIALLISVCCR
jgi:hypothetical protein